MRTAGVLDAVRGLGLHDHVCWPYDDPADFRRRAVEFLADGLALGQRAWYVADSDDEVMRGHLDELPGAAEALERGALQLHPIGETYRSGQVVTPADQVAAYAAATDQALADGYTGLRVAAEATPMVRTEASLEAFCRYEHQVDRYMAGRPFAAMCAYDRHELSEEAIGNLACMHPASGPDAAPFRLYATSASEVALAGELDLDSRERFPAALRRAGLRPIGGELVLDASELDFIDHRALFALAREGLRTGSEVVLRTALSSAARLVELLGVPGVRVEAA
ncbi:MEDS domain-containing protein [Saccharothrix coeruleofusca]|uniref:STAS domain-containing protein n=1 Tax=Saccharothrix coeruleofusca TaxID=33919 RepID=A0A918AL42_9PSEU|nr:MEDS domain-containing protein [Saccharothrix coeruleofusca]GGP41260.1 hypothetical protein GCM10010185_10470 [Saccharothrix coeruleofusca]